MRILQIQGLAAGGGCEVHTAQLCRGLRERGHHVVLLAADELNPIFDPLPALGCEVVRFPLVSTWRRLLDPAAIRKAAALIRQHRIGLVHTHLWNADAMGWAAARLTGARVVGTLHGPTIPVDIARRWYHQLHLRAYARILRRFDGILSISQFVRDHVSRDLALDPSRIEVVYNATDLAALRPGSRSLSYLDEQGIPPAGGTVIIVGELTPRKGILDFVEAAARIHHEVGDVRFLVVGRGPLREQAERRAAELGISQAMHFLGFRGDVPELLAASDVLAVTSYKEGFGRTITEAMGSGLPVVSYDSGAPAEILVHGESGLLVPEGDVQAFARAASELLRDPPRATKMGAAARDRAKALFDVSRFVDETEAVLQRVQDASPR